MPIPAMFSDSILGTFRTMMAEIEAKKLTGPAVDEMRAAMDRMESLAVEMDDFAAYSGLLAQEQVFLKFGDAYGRALSAAAASSSSAAPTDEELMAQTLKAYEDTAASYERGEGGEEAALLLPSMRRILEIGRSGVSYPVFLRKMEEEGLTRALAGAAPMARAGLEKDLVFARSMWLPRRIEECGELLDLFDRMAAVAPFGQPDPVIFGVERTRIEWRFAPLHRLWSAVAERRDRLFDKLVDWLDAHAAFAFYDARWRGPGMTDEQVRRNIRRTKECAPGDFRVLEKIVAEDYGLAWDDLWRHETFAYDYHARRIPWSDERLRLIRKTYAHCVPGGMPPTELVAATEELHSRKGDTRPTGAPPPWTTETPSVPGFRDD